MASESEVGTGEQLTAREREVQQLLRLGLTDAQIAQRLEISPAGVSYHVSEIIGKLGVRNRYEAAAWPERPPWWATALAPVALFWRKAGAALPVKPSSVAMALSAGLFIAAAGGLGLIAFLLLRDGDGGAGLALAPAATLTPPAALSPPQRVAAPTPTPVPLPTLAPTSGTLVYLRGNDLWVASLDGGRTLPPRAITNGSLASGYAGYVRREDGGIDLYYVQQETGGAGQQSRLYAEFAVYRRPLGGGGAQELLRFSSGARQQPFAIDNASVSPDGGSIAYIDRDGLVLHTISSGETNRLIENGCQDPDDILSCWSYGAPNWSPNGDMVRVSKYPFERVEEILLRPFVSPIDVINTGLEGSSRWSPDGERLCSWRSHGLYSASLAIYDLSTSETVDVLAADRLPAQGPIQGPNVDGCAWSEDGRLAVSYTPNFEEPGRIFVLDEDLNVLAESEFYDDHLAVVAWLPDGSGVIVNRFDQQRYALGPAIFQPESGITEPSFEADWVLGVIP